MSKLGKLWAGQVYGTNTGRLFADFDSNEREVSGSLRFNDDAHGLTVYSIAGTFDGSRLMLTGENTQAPENVEVGDITVEGVLTSEGQLRGQWSCDVGTAGTFVLYPHDLPQSVNTKTDPLPERMHTAVRSIGALRLYGDDVGELIGYMARDFRVPRERVVVTYNDLGTEVSRYAGDVEPDFKKMGKAHFLRLFVQEPEAYGINRAVTVQLNANGVNEVRVQGVQESWVIGKAETIAEQLRKHQKSLATTFRKFGFNIYGAFIVGALALMPDLSLWRRLVFLAAVLVLAGLAIRFHSKFIPNVVIYFAVERPSALRRAWPQIVSWIVTTLSAVVATFVYELLKGGFPKVSQFIQLLVEWLV